MYKETEVKWFIQIGITSKWQNWNTKSRSMRFQSLLSLQYTMLILQRNLYDKYFLILTNKKETKAGHQWLVSKGSRSAETKARSESFQLFLGTLVTISHCYSGPSSSFSLEFYKIFHISKATRPGSLTYSEESATAHMCYPGSGLFTGSRAG